MANILSRQKKNKIKNRNDYYDLVSMAQGFGSDFSKKVPRRDYLDNYIDAYPDFKAWSAPTVSLEHEMHEIVENKSEEMKQ